MKNMFGSLEFGPVSNDTKVLALSPFGVAIRRTKAQEEPEYVVYNKESGEITDINNLKMDIPTNPFYAVPASDLEVGDLVKVKMSNGSSDASSGRFQYLYVKEVGPNGYKFIDPTTGTICNKVTIGNLLGINFHTKIVSLINFDGDEVDSIGGINPMMLMMMGQGDNGDSNNNNGMSSMLPLLMMGKGGAGLGDVDPMMLMMMSQNGNGGGSNMMEMMMMSQMLKGGGGKGSNPFDGLFGGKKKKVVAKPKKKAPAKKKAKSKKK